MIKTQAIPAPKSPPVAQSIDASYLKDASQFTGQASQLFTPTSEQEIAWLLKEAADHATPITIAGAGTGLTGARVPQAGDVLSLEKLNQILDIQWNDFTSQGYAIVQPGVRLKDLDTALEERNLFYPPNPGEKKAFIGGTVATNASGSRSFKYGATRRYIRRLKIILPNGELLECRPGQERFHDRSLSISSSTGAAITLTLPTYTMPEVKNSAGYYAKPHMDLVDLFIGSEGTLGVISEIELDIFRKPEAILNGIIFFNSEKGCFNFTQLVKQAAHPPSGAISADPRVLEFFDSQSLALLSPKHDWIPRSAKAALFFEQECAADQVRSYREVWLEAIENADSALPDAKISAQSSDQLLFRQFRYDLPVLVNEQVAQNKFLKIGTDLAVPDHTAEKMFHFYLEELSLSKIRYVLFGHIGENHLHANLLPKTTEENKRSWALYEKLAKQALQLGGTISAEHGIGKVRIPYLELMVGRGGLRQMAQLKKTLDPSGILNPGNLFPIELFKEV